MADLLVDFHNNCDSLQPQRQSSIVSKIEDMIFNEEKIIEKIHKVMKAKKKQNELMSVMEKLQIEVCKIISLFGAIYCGMCKVCLFVNPMPVCNTEM